MPLSPPLSVHQVLAQTSRRHVMSTRSEKMPMSCSAYLSQSEQMNVASSNFAPYDQYEVSIPMDIAGDCLQMVRCHQPFILQVADGRHLHISWLILDSYMELSPDLMLVIATNMHARSLCH